MPDIIQLLPDSIANQIAAGEVVQRPASVVKELLENSVDAGATNIQLIVNDAGRTLIQVIDNGCGMSETDGRMSFERHATSKIRAFNDLYQIRTMGFRGEALASISAVSQVTLKSRQHDKELGTEIQVDGSEVVRHQPCQCSAGTSIAVRNLFFNTPARRNFLKSNTVETRHLLDEFQRLALAHPEVAFTMHHNGAEVYHLSPVNLRQRIVQLFGANHNQRLVPVNESTDVLKIEGFIGKPEHARKTRGEQFFFANNRFIKSAYLHHAVMNAYKDLIPGNSYPLYVIFLDLDPARMDINVHPTKQEIKFEDDKLIYAYLLSAIKHALSKFSVSPTLDFDQESSFQQMTNRGGSGRDFYQEERQFEREKQAISATAPESKAGWQELYKVLQEKGSTDTVTIESDWGDQPVDTEQDRVNPYQLHQRFIIMPVKSGYLLVDQQAAHERILYERFLKAFDKHPLAVQKQLFPQTINLSPADTAILKDILPEINLLGFDVQEFGSNTFVVHGTPADIPGNGQMQMLEGLLEQFRENLDLKLGKRMNLAQSLAVNSAIKPGTPLQNREMQQLLDELFACDDFQTAPNGRQVFIKYTLEDIIQQMDKKR